MREATAKLVAYLGEVEARRLHLEAGFPSMFAFCTRELGMSENEAFRRLVAARLGRRFPVIHSLLASGAVHLSTLELLRERLTEENHTELLEAVSGKSKNDVLALLAARFPNPDVPSAIRKLPEGTAGGHSTGSTSTFELSSPRPVQGIVSQRGRIEPLSEARYRVEFTAGAELREKLELCRDLMSHANPGRELSVVVERAVDLLLAELEKKRLGRTRRSQDGRACEERRNEERRNEERRSEEHPSETPRDECAREEAARQTPQRVAKSGRIARATRRQVFERDGLQCSYVSPEGRRCDARAFLELDHVEPRALGGADDAANLRVRCRSHNQLAAEQVFGRETMETCRHFVRPKSEREQHGGGTEASRCPLERKHEHEARGRRPMDGPSTMERVRVTLKGMGFRENEARQAVARVESLHKDAQTLALEPALREALVAATANRFRS